MEEVLEHLLTKPSEGPFLQLIMREYEEIELTRDSVGIRSTRVCGRGREDVETDRGSVTGDMGGVTGGVGERVINTPVPRQTQSLCQ